MECNEQITERIDEMYILIKHRESYGTNVSGIISRITDEQFFCEVFWTKDFLNDDRKIKLEKAIEKYINEKSEFVERDYLIRWKQIRFKFSKEHFEKFDSYEIRANKMMNKYVKPIGE